MLIGVVVIDRFDSTKDYLITENVLDSNGLWSLNYVEADLAGVMRCWGYDHVMDVLDEPWIINTDICIQKCLKLTPYFQCPCAQPLAYCSFHVRRVGELAEHLHQSWLPTAFWK